MLPMVTVEGAGGTVVVLSLTSKMVGPTDVPENHAVVLLPYAYWVPAAPVEIRDTGISFKQVRKQRAQASWF